MPRPAGDLLTDVDGRITHVFQALPAEDVEAVPRLMECHHAVRSALGVETACTVLLHPEHEDAVRAQLEPARPGRLLRWTAPRTLRLSTGAAAMEGPTLRVRAARAWSDFTPWVQDAFLVRPGLPAPTLLASPGVRRPFGSRDEDVPGFLAKALGWRSEPLACALEASNVLADSGQVLVGAGAVSDLPRATRDALFEQIGGDKRTAVIPMTGAQPVVHQDLYLTLAGGAKRGPLALVGSRRVAAGVRGTRFTADETEAALDGVARDLEQLGYAVARLPLEPHLERSVQRGWTTYNNALVEVVEVPHAGWDRRVILPAYGTDGGRAMEELDAAASEIWSGRGFDVRFAEGPFDWLAARAGSVRCLTKVLERG